jgi:DNA invertase Pin-like site-specific DNA recombinase
VFHVFAALAEFIRELIVQGTHEGWRQRGPAASASADRRR